MLLFASFFYFSHIICLLFRWTCFHHKQQHLLTWNTFWHIFFLYMNKYFHSLDNFLLQSLIWIAIFGTNILPVTIWRRETVYHFSLFLLHLPDHYCSYIDHFSSTHNFHSERFHQVISVRATNFNWFHCSTQFNLVSSAYFKCNMPDEMHENVNDECLAFSEYFSIGILSVSVSSTPSQTMAAFFLFGNHA